MVMGDWVGVGRLFELVLSVVRGYLAMVVTWLCGMLVLHSNGRITLIRGFSLCL